MSPRRRSKRLRGSSATPKSNSYATNRPLSSLAERDESPAVGPQSTLDAIVSSPLVPRTPATAGRVKPDFSEMHPSLAHHSTTQKPDSGLRLGFMDIDAKGDIPSGVKQQTPSKDPAPKASTTFDFRFAHPAPQLGPEAQRMMDGLREQALHIKAKLAAEREEKKSLSGEDTTRGVAGRKIAQPKGKVGRFSDVHMAEFKKMDSIAGHPSSFRAQPARIAPPVNSLKRTQSKAKLAEREEILEEKRDEGSTERLENTVPSKRARQAITDDTSSARPVSQDGNHKPNNTPTLSRANLLASITTPTKASLARAASIKKPSTQIPSLLKSPSKPSIFSTPRKLHKLQKPAPDSALKVPKSEPNRALRTPGRFDKVKSILRHPSASLKKPTAIPSLVRSANRPNVDKALPPIPTTPSGIPQSKSVKTMKHVNFITDDGKKDTAAHSPSPIKSGIPRSAAKLNLTQKLQSAARSPVDEVQYPSVAGHPNLAEEIKYPSLNNPRPLPQLPRTIKPLPRPPPSVPGSFTFRSDHTINFGASPKGFGSSPGQSSIRQVRPSILPTTMPGSFPETNKENNSGLLPSIPHGVSNKKRRRDSDVEEEEAVHSPSKKHKAVVAEGDMLMAPRLVAEKKATQSQNTSPAKKKGLSLSRLNMLSRPKMRK